MKKKANRNRGVMGLDVAKSFLLVLLALVVIGVAVIIVLKQLGNTSVVASDNDTQNVISNATSGLSSFFSNTPTWLALLSIVIIMLIIAVVIFAVSRFGGGSKRDL